MIFITYIVSLYKNYLNVYNRVLLIYKMIGVFIVGGLCNRLFQICFGYSMSIKYNTDFCFENWDYVLHHSNKKYEWLLERFASLSNYVHTPVKYNIEYREKTFELVYDEKLFKNVSFKSNNLIAHGYFQSEKHFIDYRENILELLKEPSYVSEYINSANIRYLDEGYFLHIRLGDYVNNSSHWINLEKYYIRCLNLIPDNVPIFVFSNFPKDIIKCYPNLPEMLLNKNAQYIDIDDEVISLYLMARCKKGGICANSSFSWWASWLNTNETKKVFMPNKWFNVHSNTKDIYPSYATVIPVG